jgi:formylglycine-generating enzyme required for sulfatase activity
MFKKIIFAIFLLLITGCKAMASDIRIGQFRLLDRRVDSALTHMVVSMQWNDSWRMLRGQANHDAAWLFFKCRVGQQDYRSAPGAESVGRIIRVSSTEGIRPGQPVWVASGTGMFSDTTRVLTVLGAQSFEVDRLPAVALGGGATVVATTRIWEPVYPDTGGRFAGLMPDRSWPAARLQAGLLYPDQPYEAYTNPVVGYIVTRNDVSVSRSTFLVDSLRFRWNYGRQQIPAEALLDVQVFVIEMVWIPPGAHSIPVNQSNGVGYFLLATDSIHPHPHNRQLTDEGRHRFPVISFGSVAPGVGGPLPGKGSCLCMAGDSAILELPDSLLQPTHLPITVEAWVWVQKNGVFRLAGNLNPGQNLGFALQADPAQGLWWRVGTLESSPRGSPFPLERWVHLAGVREGNVWRCFVNGILTGTLIAANNPALSGLPWQLGGRRGSSQDKMFGCLGGLRVFSDSCVYPGGQSFDPDPRPFVRTGRERLLLRFQDYSVYDAAFRHTLATRGGVLARNRNTGSRGVGDGMGDVCFDGTGRLEAIGISAELPLNSDATIEFWARIDSVTAVYQPVLAMPDILGFTIGFDSSGWSVRLGGQPLLSGGAAPQPFQWQHIALVRRDSLFTLYVQGIPQAAAVRSGPIVGQPVFTFGVGGDPTGSSFRGCLNRFIWTEGAVLYPSAFQPPVRVASHPFPQAEVYVLASEGVLTMGGGDVNALRYRYPAFGDDFHSAQARTLPAAYPKGTAGYYLMKHEVSQGLYRDFLNSLTRLQQNARSGALTQGMYATGFGEGNLPVFRQAIRVVEDPGGQLPRTYACDFQPSGQLPVGVDQTQDGISTACAFLSWSDGAAFSDWAGLRPCTEPEYEKAARGNLPPRLDEYAWGNARAAWAGGLAYAGTDLERVVSGNVHGNDSLRLAGPLRVGATARPASGTVGSGISPTGVYDLSGNVWEQVVSWSNVAGRSYTGLHGDGRLNIRGEADVSHWPGLGGNHRTDTTTGAYTGGIGVTTAAGAGMRGGGWKSQLGQIRLSDRSRAAQGANMRLPDVGFRAARTYY